jgi:superfamily I DNA and/or RNA helicase
VAENAESLLDYALDKGIYSVMLDKNYRSSAAALMSFSSKEFYKSKLDVLDDNKQAISKAIEVINVHGK